MQAYLAETLAVEVQGAQRLEVAWGHLSNCTLLLQLDCPTQRQNIQGPSNYVRVSSAELSVTPLWFRLDGADQLGAVGRPLCSKSGRWDNTNHTELGYIWRA